MSCFLALHLPIIGINGCFVMFCSDVFISTFDKRHFRMAALHALSIGYSLLSLVYQQCSLFHRLPLNLFCFIKSTFD